MTTEFVLFHRVPFSVVVQCFLETPKPKDDLFQSFFKDVSVDEIFKGLSGSRRAFARTEALAEAAYETFKDIPDSNGKVKRLRDAYAKQVVWNRIEAARKAFSVLPVHGASVLWTLPTADIIILIAFFVDSLNNKHDFSAWFENHFSQAGEWDPDVKIIRRAVGTLFCTLCDPCRTADILRARKNIVEKKYFLAEEELDHVRSWPLQKVTKIESRIRSLFQAIGLMDATSIEHTEIGLYVSKLQKYFVDHRNVPCPVATAERTKRKRDGESNFEGSKKIREETRKRTELESDAVNSQDFAELDTRSAEKVQKIIQALQKEERNVSAVTEQKTILEFTKRLWEAEISLNAVSFSTAANETKITALKTIQDMSERVKKIINVRVKENHEKVEIKVKEAQARLKSSLGARNVDDELFVRDVQKVQEYLTAVASDVDAFEFFDVEDKMHADAKLTIQNLIDRCLTFLAMRQTEHNKQSAMSTDSEEKQNSAGKDNDQDSKATARHLVSSFTANKSLPDILASLHKYVTWETKWTKPTNDDLRNIDKVYKAARRATHPQSLGPGTSLQEKHVAEELYMALETAHMQRPREPVPSFFYFHGSNEYY